MLSLRFCLCVCVEPTSPTCCKRKLYLFGLNCLSRSHLERAIVIVVVVHISQNVFRTSFWSPHNNFSFSCFVFKRAISSTPLLLLLLQCHPRRLVNYLNALCMHENCTCTCLDNFSFKRIMIEKNIAHCIRAQTHTASHSVRAKHLKFR